MTAETTDHEVDVVIRIAEIVVLALLTIGYLVPMHVVIIKWLTTYEILKFDTRQWLGLAGIWGLVSLWWLVIKVTPHSASTIKKLPWGVRIGIVLGVGFLAVFLYGYFQRTFNYGLVYVVFLLPLVILIDRLRVLWRYRDDA